MGAALGVLGLFCFFYFAIIAVIIAGTWKIFSKAGKPGWASLVPIYNVIVFVDIIGKPGSWIAFLLIPPISFVFGILACIELAKCFGKSTGFALGLIFLAPIFIPILGFGSAEYLGPGGDGSRPKRRREDDYEDEDYEEERPRKRVASRGRDEDFEDEGYDEPRKEAVKVRQESARAGPPPAAANEPVIVQCSCGKRLKVPPSALGKKVKCPGCGNAFVAQQ